MNGRLAAGGLAVLAVAALGWFGRPHAEGDRPKLALVTSLPLIFPEEFALEGGGSPALARLEQFYDVEPIPVADSASLKGVRLLLMAQPRAQPAEALVALDRWVRAGGRLLLLADPRLDWPSQRPLGDLLRPPPMFADTGLLGHWGLTLSLRGDSTVGELRGGGCAIAADRAMARCRIGKGRATIIADADFIDDAEGLDRLTIELDRLETR